MLIFFFLMLALSAVLLLGATAMERSAIKAGINGANGLAILAAFIVSGLASLVASLIAAMIWGWVAALASLVLSGLWHGAMWKIVMTNIQALIDRKLANRNGA
jgi:hypothetical protein